MEAYYRDLLPYLKGHTVQGLFDGDRNISQIQTLQTGPNPRVFFFDQEPMIRKLDEPLWQYLNQQPTIFANSELNSSDKTYAFAAYPNLVDWYMFSHALLSKEWFGPQNRVSANIWPIELDLSLDRFGQEDRKVDVRYDFLLDCNLITGARQYRLKLLYELSRRGLLDAAFYSFNADQPWQQDLIKHDQFGLAKEGSKLTHYIPKHSVSYDEFGTHLHGRAQANTGMQQVIPIDQLLVTHFVLVAETVFSENKQHLTEKTFKAIAAGKPFVLASGVHALKYIRSYDYETFGETWDESYDDIEDPAERLEAIVDLVQWFCALPRREKLDRSYRAQEIALANWQRFWINSRWKPTQEALANLEQAKIKALALDQE